MILKGGKIVKGTTLEELYELITYNHEAEFIYKEKEYVLQPEVKDGKSYLIICESPESFDNPKYLCRKETPGLDFDKIPKEIIDAVFSEKCFDGKSFLEIEKDVTVTCIF